MDLNTQSQMNPWRAIFIVLILLAMTIGALWLISQFIKSDVALGVIGFAGAIATASLQYRAAKEKEVASRLFSEKQKVYTELVTLIMKLFTSGSELAIGVPSEELVESLQGIRTKLIIWGSFDTVKSLDKMGEAGTTVTETANPAEGLIWLAHLMTNIRKDLGHKDPKAAGIEMAVGVIKAEERQQVRDLISKSKHGKSGK